MRTLEPSDRVIIAPLFMLLDVSDLGYELAHADATVYDDHAVVVGILDEIHCWLGETTDEPSGGGGGEEP